MAIGISYMYPLTNGIVMNDILSSVRKTLNQVNKNQHLIVAGHFRNHQQWKYRL